MTDLIPDPPGYVRWATQTLEDAGYETWAVGGAIRNTLLGLPSGDWDLATRAPPGVVRRLFPRTIPVGIEHGTVGVLTREGTLLELTTFRRDVETFGRKAVVEFAETLEEDLSRRDFTVNAVAWHPLVGRFEDPFGGREDLKKGILRTVGSPWERFSEDYLRVLRGLRFSGLFRFLIEEETWRALRGAMDHLGVLSPERVREELMKVLSGDPRPSGALSLYHMSGALEALYPEVAAVGGIARSAGAEDLLVHSFLLTDALPAGRPLLRLGSLLHGIGAPAPAPGGGGGISVDTESGTGGDRLGRDRAAALMIRLRFSNAEIRTVTEMIQVGLEAPTGTAAPAEVRRWLHRATPELFPSLARVWVAKARMDRLRWGVPPDRVVALVRRMRAEVHSGAPLRSEELALDGRDLISLGLRPGPAFKDILGLLMERVLDEPGLNRTDRLRELAAELAGVGPEEGA